MPVDLLHGLVPVRSEPRRSSSGITSPGTFRRARRSSRAAKSRLTRRPLSVDAFSSTDGSSQIRLRTLRADSVIRIVPERRLRGNLKLSAALDRSRFPLRHGWHSTWVRVPAVTTALLTHGARRVYAVEVGIGQLVGRLRGDPRVVNLEGHNLGVLDPTIVPEPMEIITMDLSYLALSASVPQLEAVDVDDHADLVALVKPTFELRRAAMVTSDMEVTRAVDRAAAVINSNGWHVQGLCPAPRDWPERSPRGFHSRSSASSAMTWMRRAKLAPFTEPTLKPGTTPVYRARTGDGQRGEPSPPVRLGTGTRSRDQVGAAPRNSQRLPAGS